MLYIWCAMDPISIPPNVSIYIYIYIYSSTMDPMGMPWHHVSPWRFSRPCWGLRCNLRLPTLPADRAAATHRADCVAHRDRGIWQRAPRKPRKVGELGSRKWRNARDFLWFPVFLKNLLKVTGYFVQGLIQKCVESNSVPWLWQIPVFSPPRWRLGMGLMCHRGVTSWASSQPFERWRGVFCSRYGEDS